jgi:hypothetical protein
MLDDVYSAPKSDVPAAFEAPSHQASWRSSGENKSGARVLSEMAKGKRTSTGPMDTQQIQIASICPGLPLMPIVGDEPKASKPRERAPERDAAAKADATITRRKSLKKQREGQKVRPL